jgi:hypothetical protein
VKGGAVWADRQEIFPKLPCPTKSPFRPTLRAEVGQVLTLKFNRLPLFVL